MTASRLFDLLIALLYLTGSVSYPLGLVLRRAVLKKAAVWSSVVAFALHTVDLGVRFVEIGAASLQHGQFYMSLLAWFVVLIFFILWRRLKHDFLAMITAPLALVLFSSSLAVRTQVLAVPEAPAGMAAHFSSITGPGHDAAHAAHWRVRLTDGASRGPRIHAIQDAPPEPGEPVEPAAEP